MDERNEMYNGYRPLNTEKQSTVQPNDIYSTSNYTAAPAETPMTHAEAAAHYGDSFVSSDTAELNVTAPQSQPVRNAYSYTVKPAYNYESYRSQFATQEHASQIKPKKKSRKGMKIAMIACSLALAVCLGFGGGVLGAYFMQPQNTAEKIITSTASGQVVTAATAEGKDSDLKIVESSGIKNGTSTNSIQDVVTKVKDSVVEITTEATSYSSFYGQYVTQGAGSGVIISEDGYILTNNHVVEGASQVSVTLTNGKTYDAKIIGTDATYDIGLIKIEEKGLTCATFGSSSDLEVGETSIVIGNPLGKLGGTVTAGIISALNRTITIDNKNMELLQTDAAINPGNSGGGLFDADGCLVGIIVAKSVSTSNGTNVESIGFAIPIDNVKSIIGDLQTKGYVSGRASLDITAVNVLTDTAMQRYGVEQKGVYIYSLVSGGAAEQAGLVVGDLVRKFAGVEIENNTQLSSEVLKHKAGEQVDVVIYRDGEEKTISVTLGERDNNSSKIKNRNSNGFNADGGSDNNNNYYGYGDLDDFFNGFGY